MPRGTYWKCGYCGKKIFDSFGKNWFHIANLEMIRGEYETGNRYLYDNLNDLVFCELNCFLSFLRKKYGTNPSLRKKP